jgi:single-strand DNA-binding protein
MKSITIACVQSSDAAFLYKEDSTVKSVQVLVSVTTGYGDKAITAEVMCTAYGKAAEALQEMPSAHMIVVGDMEMPKGEPMRINNAKFYPGSMGLMLNQIAIAGNIGNPPEIQRFESGNIVAKFSVAVRRTKTETDWFNGEIWGKQAEVVENYVGKGSQCAIVGQLKLEQWNDKTTGALRTAFRVTGDRLTLLGGKRTQETESQGTGTSYDDNDF